MNVSVDNSRDEFPAEGTRSDEAGDRLLDRALARAAAPPPLPPGLVARIVAEVPRLPQQAADGPAPVAAEVVSLARPEPSPRADVREFAAAPAAVSPSRPFFLRRSVGFGAGLTAIAAGIAAIVLVHGTAFELRPDETAPDQSAPSLAAIQPVLPPPALASARPATPVETRATPAPRAARPATHRQPAEPPQLAARDTAPAAAPSPAASAPASPEAPVLANAAPSGARVGPPVPADLATTFDLPVAGSTPLPSAPTGMGYRPAGGPSGQR